MQAEVTLGEARWEPLCSAPSLQSRAVGALEQGGGPPATPETGRRRSKPGFGSGTEVRGRLFGRFAELGWRTWEAMGGRLGSRVQQDQEYGSLGSLLYQC